MMDDGGNGRAKKVIRNNRLVIQVNGKEYTPTGCRIK